MGIYLNLGNEPFSASVNSELYVDKTDLIIYTNSRMGKDRLLICSSRPRRFGKTTAVSMLAAYYSKGCSSERLFAGLVGFTETEVQMLCREHEMSFEEMQQWYDGYFFEQIGYVYSPNSVIEAIDSREFANY